jgi:UDP-N-acetylmuramoyl-L-alanyl-D-glutamate--2,6-diaminopimelate ligase
MAAELQPGIRLADLVTEVAVPGPGADLRVSGLALDSRALRPGDLFFALRGQRYDGREFLAAAAAAGAVAALVDAAAPAPGAPLPVFAVADLAQRISAIAGRFYGEPSHALAVTGITGTNGKTSCCQLLAQLFTALEAPAGAIGTLGAGLLGAAPRDTGFTTPDAIATQRLLAELRAAGARRVAMEVSSHSLAQGRVAAVRLHTALFTNLSRDHLDYHADMAAYREAKARLFRQPELQVAVVNVDDPAGRAMAAALPAQVRRLGYSAHGDGAELRVARADFGPAGIRARIATPWGAGELASPLPGAFNLANLLAVIAAACGQGFALDAVLAAVPGLRAAPGRMQEVGGGRPRVIVDYAHTPDALAQALAALRPVTRGRLWCVFGCGGERDRGKRPQMGAIAAQGADHLVLTSDNPRGEDPQGIVDEILAGLSASQRHAVAVMADRRQAIEHAIAAAAPEDCVLIAGKGHETWQEIRGVRWPFADAAVARAALAVREGDR